MRHGLILSAGLLLVSVSVSGLAHGATPDRAGVDLGVRVGYAIPFGDLDGTRGSLAGWVSGAIPVVLEAGYRFNHRFSLGPYFQLAYAQVKENSSTMCNGQSGCSGWIVRAGLQAIYHPDLMSPRIKPWVGLGAGYEWTNYSGTVLNTGFSGSATGWEYVNLQVGGDVPVGPGTAVGPFVAFSLGRYDSVSNSLGAVTLSPDVTKPSVHEWLMFGVRLVFGL